MKISLRLSNKTNALGRSEVLFKCLLRINGRIVTMRAKSEVWVRPDLFSPERGVDFSRKRVISSDEREWHIKMQEKLNGILTAVATAEMSAQKSAMTCDWLRNVVEVYLHPENGTRRTDEYDPKECGGRFAALMKLYIVKHDFSDGFARSVKVVTRVVLRYQGYRRATMHGERNFEFNVDTITGDVIEDFRDYLAVEHNLAEQYPKLYEKLIADYPEWLKCSKREVGQRGSNVVVTYIKRLRSFFRWLYETKHTTNRPFEGVKIGGEKYGTPYYITTEERDQIAACKLPTEYLQVQRDIFVFQCYVGCRVGDLMKLTEENIVDGVLTYAPHKTKDEGEQTRLARIPLHSVAQKLIAKYKDKDPNGRLFPFVSPQNYNYAIKDIFTRAGVTRPVNVRNALTDETELRPINEIASSHLARRTFIGNAYKFVADPNIIGKMSGHVEGSKAFARYRNIEDDTLRSVIEKL